MIRSSILLLGLVVAGCGYHQTVDVRKPQGEFLACLKGAPSRAIHSRYRDFFAVPYVGDIQGNSLVGVGMASTPWRIDTEALGPNLTRATVDADREWHGMQGPREAFNAALGFVYACN